jgi:ribosome-dependent ATPase
LGDIFPGTYFLTICRGTFNKALGFADLGIYLLPLVLAILLMVGSSVLLLDKQER